MTDNTIQCSERIQKAATELVAMCNEEGCAIACSIAPFDRLQRDLPPGVRQLQVLNGPGLAIAGLAMDIFTSVTGISKVECEEIVHGRRTIVPPQIPYGDEGS
jgi:hypothetical protein